MPEVAALDGLDVLCVYGAGDRHALCPTPPADHYGLLAIGHGHFDHEYAAWSTLILRGCRVRHGSAPRQSPTVVMIDLIEKAATGLWAPFRRRNRAHHRGFLASVGHLDLASVILFGFLGGVAGDRSIRRRPCGPAAHRAARELAPTHGAHRGHPHGTARCSCSVIDSCTACACHAARARRFRRRAAALPRLQSRQRDGVVRAHRGPRLPVRRGRRADVRARSSLRGRSSRCSPSRASASGSTVVGANACGNRRASRHRRPRSRSRVRVRTAAHRAQRTLTQMAGSIVSRPSFGLFGGMTGRDLEFSSGSASRSLSSPRRTSSSSALRS